MPRVVASALVVAAVAAATQLVAAPAPAAAARCAGHRATIVGTTRANIIHGTKRADVIVARGGNDRIYSGAGNDIICAGPGNDYVSSGAGADRVYGDDGNDTLLSGAGNDSVTGGTGADRITDTSGTNKVSAGSGNDTVSTGSGGDTIDGSSGNDTIRAGSGGNHVTAGAGNDYVISGSGVDFFELGDGDDRGGAGPGPDLVYGDAGSDRISGGSGEDTMFGGDGLDVVDYTRAPGQIDVNLADSTATGDGDDYLSEFEIVEGSAYDDHLVGDNDLNVFLPGLGDDTVDGAGGNDYLMFRHAADGVIVELNVGGVTGEGTDTVTNVESAVGTDADDVFYGNGADNFFDGRDGNDSAYGFGGTNSCFAEQTSLCLPILDTTDAPPEFVDAPAGSAASTNGTREDSDQASRPDAASPIGPPPPTPPRTKQVPPPSTVTDASSGARTTGGSLSPQFVPATPGTYLSCPMLSNPILTYPPWRGYGYYAYRETYPNVLAWQYGPWLYNNGTSWIAYWYPQWYNIGGSSTFMAEDHGFTAAYWWDYASQKWYPMGECMTQKPQLIPGMYIEPPL